MDLQLTMYLVFFTTNMSSNPPHDEVFLIYYVVKFVSDLRQVGGFLQVHQ
jgi:hypothetical protein